MRSEHPYKPSMDSYDSFRIPGAAQITVAFDYRSNTEEDADTVTIFGDGVFGNIVCQHSGGYSSRWPGTSGVPPVVVPGDSFSVHFSSDYENQSWGFELRASAPVNEECAYPPREFERRLYARRK